MTPQNTTPTDVPQAGLVYEFEKNSTECVRAELTTYKGYKLLDIRAWVERDGQWIATKKGLSLSIDLLPELEAAVRALQVAVLAGADDS
jgi:hypothetical protein